MTLSLALYLAFLATLALCCASCCVMARRKKDSVEESRWSRVVVGFHRLAIKLENLISAAQIKLKILISAAQILSALGVVFSIPYPAIYLDFLQV